METCKKMEIPKAFTHIIIFRGLKTRTKIERDLNIKKSLLFIKKKNTLLTLLVNG